MVKEFLVPFRDAAKVMAWLILITAPFGVIVLFARLVTMVQTQQPIDPFAALCGALTMAGLFGLCFQPIGPPIWRVRALYLGTLGGLIVFIMTFPYMII